MYEEQKKWDHLSHKEIYTPRNLQEMFLYKMYGQNFIKNHHRNKKIKEVLEDRNHHRGNQRFIHRQIKLINHNKPL